MIRRYLPMCYPRSDSRRGALTLLELILALALSVIVIAAIGWAIQLHLQALDTRRSDVEEAQLARAVLKLIADDLHSVVAYNTINYDEAARIAAMGIPGVASGDIEEGDDNFEQDPVEGDPEATAPEEEEPPKDLSADLTPGAIPGIYGNQYQLQVDISRLPRIEDFDPALRAARGISRTTGLPRETPEPCSLIQLCPTSPSRWLPPPRQAKVGAAGWCVARLIDRRHTGHLTTATCRGSMRSAKSSRWK